MRKSASHHTLYIPRWLGGSCASNKQICSDQLEMLYKHHSYGRRNLISSGEMSSINSQSPSKRGSLTISGSGIASVSHITLGTLAHIKEAEKIFYVVCDPLTEAFIRENATGTCCDLTVYYDKDKDRYDSYVQMCEVP